MATGVWTQIAQADYSRLVADLMRVDAANRVEIVIRNCLLATGGIAMWIIIGEVWTIAWGFGFVAINLCYLNILRRLVGPIRFGPFALLLGLRVILLLFVSLMAVYAAFQGATALLLMAFCAIAGLALHTISNHALWSFVSYLDITNIALCALGIMVGVAWTNGNATDALAIGLIGTAMVFYFLHSMRDVVETRRRLTARRSAEAQAEKMQAIGQLSAGIAHDFNNILTVIRGNLDLVDFVENTPEREQFLEEAREGTDRAAHLVRQLLAFSRKSQLSVSVFCLNDFMQNCTDVLSRVMPENVRISLTPGLPRVALEVDRALLNTAILNAALNARDAMLPEGGRIHLTVRLKGRMAVVEIADTGPGLPANLFEKAVEPFYTTKPPGSGSGLGLSMIKGFAEQSGGFLELTNRVEGGFSVRIHLPIHSMKSGTHAPSNVDAKPQIADDLPVPIQAGE